MAFSDRGIVVYQPTVFGESSIEKGIDLSRLISQQRNGPGRSSSCFKISPLIISSNPSYFFGSKISFSLATTAG
jgi:hypothetical protein